MSTNRSRTRTARPKLSPVQFIKGCIIRVGLAEKVKVRTSGSGKPREAQVKFRLLWGRVALFFVCLMVAGWLSLATAAYFFVKHARDFPEVRFVDLVFPHRWEHYEEARGDYYIDRAHEMLEAGETREVIHLLRVGVQQSPNNTEGRLTLAQIYNMIGRPDLGIDLLRSRASEHADDPEYLSALISLLFANHEDTAVEELATRLLDGSTEPNERNLILAIAAATANFNRGNYDRAQQIIDDFELENSRSGTLLQARIDWELGYPDLAIPRLERILQNPGDQEEKVVNYLIEYLWSSGRQDRAQQVAFNRFVEDPLSYSPRVRLLQIYNRRGNTEKEATEVETFFELFGREEDAMNALARFAAQSEQPDLAKRIHEHQRSQGKAPEPSALALLDAHVASGNYRQALDFHETIEPEVEDWTPLQKAQLQPLLTVAHFGVDNTERGDGILSETLAERNVNPAALISLAERLIDIERFDRGRRVLNFIHQNQPLNQEALTRLIRLDIQTGNHREIVQNLQRLLEMRKPSQELLETAHRHISSDRFLFQANRSEILESLESALVSDPSQAS